MQLTSERKRLLTLLGIALTMQAILLFVPLPAWMGALVFLLWAGVIPGHLLAEVIGRQFGAPPTRLEWGLYAVGAGYCVILGVMALLSWGPNPLSNWHLHAAVDVVLLALVLAAWPIAGHEAAQPVPLPGWEPVVVGLIGLAAVAVYWLRDIAVLEWALPMASGGLAAAVLLAVGPTEAVVVQLPLFVAHLCALAVAYWVGRRLAALLDLSPTPGRWLGPVAALAVLAFGVIAGYIYSVTLLLLLLALLVGIRLLQRPHGLLGGISLAALYAVTGVLTLLFSLG